MTASYANLLSPVRIGPIELRNRIVFTGHDTLLQAPNGVISDALIAYQVARARGGAGLIVLSACAIDEFSCSSPGSLRIDTDAMIPGLKQIVSAVKYHGAAIFGQLLQAGREIFYTADGTLPVTYSASATTGERKHVIPREMSREMIAKVIQSYVDGAERFIAAGVDGVEIVGNQGNLPAQFLAASVNKRTDEYGGSLENRCRFIVELCRALHSAIGGRVALGLRLSADGIDAGVTAEESLAVCRAVDQENLVDYISLVVGNQATMGGVIHVAAPMSEKTGYVGSYTQPIKQAVGVPVMATGRFNTAQSAEAAIANGQADVIGMTRAMICDPEIGRKLVEQRVEDMRACIGCDQACIGHYQKGVPISCIQHPETGRELDYEVYPAVAKKRKILVAGGGPAGMKAAAVAAERGHEVILCEAGAELGGQALLAQRLPTREEFGGIITNLQREMELAGVEVRRRTKVTRALVAQEKPDAVVIAVGAVSVPADDATTEGAHVVTANEVIEGRATVGARVVVVDARRDWVAIGVAEQLVADGHSVRLAVNGVQPGEFIPAYVRDAAMGRLYKAGVDITSYARFYGADEGSVYFTHITAQAPIVLEGVDTVVVAFDARSDRALEYELQGLGIETHLAGDCLTPRTAEEAVLDGLKVGVRL